MTEIIFEVTEDDVDGGYSASALGYGIHTQGDSVDEIRRNVKYAALLLVLFAAPALAQPMSITASTAVTWIDLADEVPEEPLLGLGEVTMGSVYHPAVVVVWRGQPGWMFKDDSPESANTLSFAGSDSYRRTGEPIRSVSAKQGAVRLELAYDHSTREARVNGIPVRLPEGHDVILVDDADTEAAVVGTLRVGGSGPEWIETFLGRSETVRAFVRCDVPLPEDTFDNERFRRGMQTTMNERCELMAP